MLDAINMLDTIDALNFHRIIVSLEQDWHYVWTVKFTFPLHPDDPRRDGLVKSWAVKASHRDINTAFRLAQEELRHDPTHILYFEQLLSQRAGIEHAS